MARSVNVFTSEWVKTGTKVTIEQYSQKVRFDWIDDDGKPQTTTQVILFPNCLTDITIFDDAMIREIVDQTMLTYARKKASVDVTSASVAGREVER